MINEASNWKALLNRADLSSIHADKLGHSMEEKALLETYQNAIKDCEKALDAPKADKVAINNVKDLIEMKAAEVQKALDAGTTLKKENEEPKEDTATLMKRMKEHLEKEEYHLAFKVGSQIEEWSFEFENMFEMARQKRKKVPVTILTGFLGSGKTTLLNRILKENHGLRIAVIENEFGAVGVDDQLVEFQDYKDEVVIEVMNGCICCTVRQDLVETILELKGKYIDYDKIDYIIIETTGMADPAPVIQTFLLNDEIQGCTRIDSCMTICDAS